MSPDSSNMRVLSLALATVFALLNVMYIMNRNTNGHDHYRQTLRFNFMQNESDSKLEFSFSPVLPPRVSSSTFRQTNAKAALCAMVKDEEAYLDEWLDYHYGLGFDYFVLYDNSETFELQTWLYSRPRFHRSGYKSNNNNNNNNNVVTIQHWPGTMQQRHAYNHCVRNYTRPLNYTWTAFWDVDEFLVLKKHDTVLDLLHEQLPILNQTNATAVAVGALAINWYVFGMSNQTTYSPLPVTLRFQWRLPETHVNIKTIVATADFHMMRNPHAVSINHASSSVVHDTNGDSTGFSKGAGASNKHKPNDVAILHHYRYKSTKEWYHKGCIRGRVTGSKDRCHEKLPWMVGVNNNINNTNEIFDDAAWQTLKRVAPKYRIYEQWM